MNLDRDRLRELRDDEARKAEVTGGASTLLALLDMLLEPDPEDTNES